MKRIMTLLLMLITALTFTSCSSGGSDGTKAILSYEAGQWTDNVYRSEFLNTIVTVPESWTIASDDEIEKERQDVIADSLSDSETSQEEMEQSIKYELKLTNDSNYSNMSIFLEDLNIIYSNVDYSEEDAMNMYQKNMQQLSTEDLYIVAMSTPEWVTLGDNKYYMCEMEYDYNENMQTASHYQRIYLRKNGAYMTNLTMSVVDKADFAEIESMFSKYTAEK